MKRKIITIVKCILILLVLGYLFPNMIKGIVGKLNKTKERNNAIFVVNYGIEHEGLIDRIKKFIK